MRRAARRSRATLAISGALVLTLWLSVASALGSSPASTIVLGSQRPADYARDVSETFRPVGLTLVKEVLGDDAVITFREQPTSTRPDPDPEPTTDPTQKPTSSPDPRPSPTVTEQPRESLLSIRMSSARRNVHPGDTLVYTIEVENIGDTATRSGFIATHVPHGTRYVGDDLCGDTIQVDPGKEDPHACASTEEVVPPEHPGDHFGPAFSPLPPGRVHVYSFTVRVLEGVEQGTQLITHAHASAGGAETVRSRDCMVTVR